MFITNLIKYIFLGIVQGFTEPIPISSSGHLAIFKNLLNDPIFNDFNFEILVNFGSFIAILIYFRKDLIKLIKNFFLYIKTKDKEYKTDFRYCLLLVLATLPAGIAGLLLKDTVASLSTNIKFVGGALILTSIFLFLVRNIKGEKEPKDIKPLDAVVVGLFQVIALFPGVSRSGSTLVGGMFRKFKRDTAFKFAFFLYMPISAASIILGVGDMLAINTPIETWIYYLVGMVFAGIVTYLVIGWFRRIVEKGKLIYFSAYCFIVGTLVLIFLK